MILLLGWCLGIGITVMLKMVLTKFCYLIQYRSLYRVRPKGAALTSLALECWYIGVGASVLIGRISQFLFAAAFWIGRIDVPFLSEDVSLFGYSFDYVPTNFVKDIILHEAHRHPFIERLAQMYLMKLRHKRFGSVACSVWRQVAVLAYCPWLAKYRVFDHARLQQALEARSLRLQESRQDATNLGIKNETPAVITGITNDATSAIVEIATDTNTAIVDITKNASDLISGLANEVENIGRTVVDM